MPCKPVQFRAFAAAVLLAAAATVAIGAKSVSAQSLGAQLAAMRQQMLAGLEPARLEAANARLVAATPALPSPATIGDLFARVLMPATRPDARDDASIAADHRAALVVLSFDVNHWSLESLVPESRNWPRAAPHAVTLGGRADLAQHFLMSAAIAAASTPALSAALGMYKESRDAKGGSGFSFVDLAADRAGTAFGKLAAGTPASARRLRDRGLDALGDADLLPGVAGLPEGLTDAEFRARYGGVDQPAYLAMVAEIDRRIAVMPLYAASHQEPSTRRQK